MQPIAIPVTGREDAADPASPKGALSEFYRAFNTRDIGLMQQNWLDGDAPVMNNPLGGVRRGWREIRPTYERLFGHPDARVEVEFFEYTIHDLGDGFVAIGRERGALVRSGEMTDVAIRTTRIFVRSNDRYRQLHHHGSIEDPSSLGAYRTAFA